MTLPRPTLELEVDGTTYDGASAAVTRLCCTLSVDATHDQLICHVAPQSPLADVDVDVPLTLSLGNTDAPEAVFAGTVRAVERTARGVVIEAYADSWLLSQLFVAQSYLETTVADIVSDLAGQAGVSTDSLEGPLTLSAYHIDERRSAWSYVAELAEFGGFDLPTTKEGALSLLPASSSAGGLGAAGILGGAFRAGAELLSWRIGPRSESASASGYAYGAGSEAGAEKWHVLLKDPGSGTGAVRVLPTARTSDVASAWSDARAAAVSRAKLSGHAVLVGMPAVRAGDTRDFELPTFELTARCRQVVHHLSATSGFVTSLELEGSA